jgi:DNA polymerase-1
MPTLNASHTGTTSLSGQGFICEPLALDEQNGYIRTDGTVGTLTTDESSPKHNNRVIVREATSKGYAESICGRRRYLPDLNSANANLRNFAQRNAVNMPIQASSADMIKIAMINIYKEFEKQSLKSKMILQVHDELVFDVYKPELEIVKAIVKQQMINALQLEVPIEISMNSGDNWLIAH